MTAENETGRDPLEELASEFIERQRNGERPSISEYVAKHPELADEIHDLFPTIAAVERLKIHKEHSTDGRASLGPVKIDRLGDFRIIREIGRGGMGVVFEAEQESLARRVAVKVLPGHSILDPENLRRFEREARFAARLHHTNIVPVIGVGEQSGFHYIVMQFIRGVGLDRIIKALMRSDRLGPTSSEGALEEKPDTAAAGKEELEAVLSQLLNGTGRREDRPLSTSGTEARYWKTVAGIGMQAAEALHYGHSQGTLHRDVKPANLLLDTRGVVWITDFGVAKAIQSDDVTRTTDVTGTLRYIAPERFHGRTDARSDIYSLGLTLYELATLRWAFDAADQHALTMQIVNRELVAPRKINPRIPRDLETIVQKATAREPDHRYSTAGELAADLQRFVEDRPIQARRTTPVERLWFWCRRNPVTAGLTSAVLVLLILVAIVATTGYVKTKNSNRLVTQALDGEKEQRQKAEATSGLALDVLDRIYTQFAPARFDDGMNLTVEDSEGNEIEIPAQPALSRETAALLDSLLVFYDRLAEQGGDDAKLRQKRASANHRVGTIQQYLGQFEQAEAAYLRALDIFGDQGTETAKIYNELGRLYRTTTRPDEGFAAHRKALSLLEKSATEADRTFETRFELARTFYYLGSEISRDLDMVPPGPPPGSPRGGPGQRGPGPGRFRPPPSPSGDRSFRPPPRRNGPGKQAGPAREGRPRAPADQRPDRKQCLDKAIALLDDLIAESPSDPACRHLLGLCYRDRSRGIPLDQSADPLKDAVRILEELVDEYPDLSDFRFELAKTYALWDVRRLPHELHATAEVDLEKALDILEHLVIEHPHVPSYLMARVHALHKLGDILRRTDRLDLARTTIEKALVYQKSLSDRFPGNSSYEQWTVVIQNSLARLLRDLNRFADAERLLEESLGILGPLMAAEPLPDQIRGLLIECYMEKRDLYHLMGDENSAREMFDKAQELRRNRDKTPKPDKKNKNL